MGIHGKARANINRLRRGTYAMLGQPQMFFLDNQHIPECSTWTASRFFLAAPTRQVSSVSSLQESYMISSGHAQSSQVRYDRFGKCRLRFQHRTARYASAQGSDEPSLVLLCGIVQASYSKNYLIHPFLHPQQGSDFPHVVPCPKSHPQQNRSEKG